MYYQDDFSKVMYNETVFYEYLEEVEERAEWFLSLIHI